MSSSRKKSSAAGIENTRRYISDHVLDAAKALIEVCRDPEASPQSKAAAGNAIFRAAGLFDRPAEKFVEKDPHEMTAEELAAAIDAVERTALERQTGAEDRDAFA